jgi:hypothetical protein
VLTAARDLGKAIAVGGGGETREVEFARAELARVRTA